MGANVIDAGGLDLMAKGNHANLTTKITAKKINLGEMLKKLEISQDLDGVLDLNINLKGQGKSVSDIIMIDDPDKTLLGTGTVNLKTEALDFGIQTQPQKGLGTNKTGKVSVSLSAITKPFKLGGTLANPSLGISPVRVAETAGSVLLVPGGWASLFVSVSSGKENPCAVAPKTAGEGTPKATAKSGKEKEQKGTREKKKEGLGSKIKNLFSKPKE